MWSSHVTALYYFPMSFHETPFMCVPEPITSAGEGSIDEGSVACINDSDPLNLIVSRQTFSPWTPGSEHRRYSGTFVTTTVLHGRSDHSLKPVTYRLQPICNEPTLNLLYEDGADKIESSLHLHNVGKTDLGKAMRETFSAVLPQLTVDLAGVICRLAAALTLYSNTGSLTLKQISAGAQLKMEKLVGCTKHDIIQLYHKGTVYVPNQPLFAKSPDAILTIIYAVNGEGGKVLLEQKGVDVISLANKKRVLPRTPEDIANGVYDALRMLMYMYEKNDAGAMAAMALTKGVHSITKALGSRTEGGLVREAWRSLRFEVPSGAFFVDTECEEYRTCGPLPLKLPIGNANIQAFMDGIALKTAALSAMSDPLQSLEERRYPTVIRLSKEPNGEHMSVEETKNELQEELTTQVMATADDYAYNYLDFLTDMFTTDVGDIDAAVKQFLAMLRTACAKPAVMQSFQSKTIHWMFWVEPTTLFEKCDNHMATNAGYGVLVGCNERKEMDPFPKGKLITSKSARLEFVEMEFCSMRAVPAVVHHYKHREGGLQFMKPFLDRALSEAERDEDCKNFQIRVSHDVALAMRAKKDMNWYLPEQAVASIPSPAEYLYFGKSLRLVCIMEITEGSSAAGLAKNAVISPVQAVQNGLKIYYSAMRPFDIPDGRQMKVGREL